MRNLKQRLPRPARLYAALGAALALVCVLLTAQAQFGGGRRRGGRYGDEIPYERLKEQEMMQKAIDPAFKEDVFTFARLRFGTDYGGGYGRGGHSWNDDTPNADLMLTFRLFEGTSLKVRPGLTYIDITTKELADYPFVYMAGAGRASLSEEEADALRHYLLNGGFLMVDDFWGDEAWEHFSQQLKLIFPDRAPELLDLTHPIFHSVYNFKKQPQIPSAGVNYNRPPDDYISYDPGYDYDRMNHDPHYYGVYDDKRRLVMLICHNNHYGDGWEHEGDDITYFDLFTMPMGYPMLINILSYVMSH